MLIHKYLPILIILLRITVHRQSFREQYRIDTFALLSFFVVFIVHLCGQMTAFERLNDRFQSQPDINNNFVTKEVKGK